MPTHPVAAGDPVPTEDKYPSLDECRSNRNVDKDKSLSNSQVGPHEDIPANFASQDGLILVRGMLLPMLILPRRTPSCQWGLHDANLRNYRDLPKRIYR